MHRSSHLQARQEGWERADFLLGGVVHNLQSELSVAPAPEEPLRVGDHCFWGKQRGPWYLCDL